MKTIFTLILALILTGCATKEDSPSINANVEQDNITAVSVEGAGLGEQCGGMENILCEIELECQKNIYNAEEMGLCVKSIIDETMECPKYQKPVCGMKNNRKNGYLNDCEAARHGATIIYDGFCKKNDKVVGSCYSITQPIGICNNLLTGYQFNSETISCEKTQIFACDLDTPFTTMSECEKKCVVPFNK